MSYFLFYYISFFFLYQFKYLLRHPEKIAGQRN